MKKLLAVLLSVMMVAGIALSALAENSVKDETVYVLAIPDGAARKIIVSDWLTNPDALDQLADETRLSDVENVKGSEVFDSGVWQAAGQDIYYQGISEEPLPVTVAITYTLDGEEIAPAELAGKDGHVVIRFAYTVNETAAVTIQDHQENLQVPFVVLTAALLENDVFTNVAATNAHIVNDGDHTVIVGAALPGLQESLNLDPDTLRLPEYVEIEADVKNFALPVTVTLATSEIFAKMDTDQLNDLDDLKQSMADLTGATVQLLDGGTQLTAGLNDLNSGAIQLSNGVTALSNGLTELISNNQQLIAGSTQVFETLLATANQQLAATGADVPELTIDTYEETLSALINAMSEEGIAQQAQTQVEQSVRAQADQVRAAVTQAVQAEVSAQVEVSVQDTVREQVLASLNMTVEEYESAKAAGLLPEDQELQLNAAISQQMESDEVQALLTQHTEAQMESDDIQALIDQNTEAQIQALIEQNMASDTVQKQIAQNVAQYQASSAALTALKEQLDSYNTFHTGLIAYTEGACTAASGAQQLEDSLPALLTGIAQLTEGASSLTDGLDQLNTLVTEDLNTLIDRVHALIDAAASYQNYAGLADGTSGTVRFIWRTDAIEQE